MNKTEQMKLLLTGLAAGDSLGSTSEFVDREAIPALYQKVKKQGWPFQQIGGGSFGWKPGAPTDDTDMAMCLVRSYREIGHFDGAEVARRFVDWLNASPSDIGMATRRGLSAVRNGAAWYEGGLAEYKSNRRSAGNGSLMRNGVVPAMADSLEEAFRISLHQSLITHYAPMPVVCCAAQSYLLWEILAGRNPFASNWSETFTGAFADWLKNKPDAISEGWRENTGRDLEAALSELGKSDWGADSFNPFTLDFGHADGYCLLTLQIAVWAAQWSLRAKPFPISAGFPSEVFQKVGPYVLSWVAMIGHDSDTYGAAAGPLIAAIHGRLSDGLIRGLLVLDEMR